MTPTRRKAEKITKPEKSIGATGALSSNDAQKPSVAGSPAPAAGPSTPASVSSTSAAVSPAPAAVKRPSVAKAAKVTPKAKAEPEKPVAADASPQADSPAPAATKRPSIAKGGSKKVRAAFAIVAVLVMLAAVAFSWYRWLYGNDALNIQGAWYVNGSDATIAITEEEIVLSEDVSYAYTLDATGKTIEFFFSDFAGCGHYRFSLDRGELAIIDGECSGINSITSDFAWLLGALFFELQGKEAAPAEGEGVMLLSREPISLVEEGPAEGEGTAEGEVAAGGEAGSGEAAPSTEGAAEMGEGTAEGEAAEDLAAE